MGTSRLEVQFDSKKPREGYHRTRDENIFKRGG